MPANTTPPADDAEPRHQVIRAVVRLGECPLERHELQVQLT
jgi:hypothetical protein